MLLCINLLGTSVYAQNAEAQLERGKHLVDNVGWCSKCHGANLAGGEMKGPWGKYPNMKDAEYAAIAAFIKSNQ